MDKLLEMRRQIKTETDSLDELLNKADSENRNMTEEEIKQYDEGIKKVQTMKAQQERYIEVNKLQDELGNYEPLKPEPESRDTTKEDEDLRKHSFFEWMRKGRGGLSDIENRSLVEDATGQILVPEDITAEIIRALPELTVMRQLCGVRTTNRDRVKIRSLTEVNMGWGKLETGSAITESTPVPSSDSIYVEDLTGLVKIGRDELQDADYNLQAYIQDSLANKRAEVEDTAFAIGTGHANLQPDGIAVDTDITNVNLDTADTMTVEDLIELFYTVPAKYRKNASFLMNSLTEMAVRNLRAEVAAGYYGDFLWQPNVQAGKPNTLLGHPVYNQDDMNYPADATAAKVVMFGDFKRAYRIIDRAQISIVRLDELYAEAGLVGFMAYFRVGGGIVQTDAMRALYNNT